MRLLFAGTPGVAVVALDALLASRHEVVAVLTRPDAAAGRGRTLRASEVALRAQEVGLPSLKPGTMRDPDVISAIRDLGVDAAPIVAFGGLIPPDALAVPRLGWVNLHFSLLPAWRGAAPVQRSIMAGDDITGATTFRLEEGLDTGPVYGVVTEVIRPTDTAGDLLDRLSRSGAELLVRTLDAMEAGTAVPVPQPSEGVSLGPRVHPDDARVRWDLPARAIDRLVRGTTPEPGAWTQFRGERLGLGPVVVVDDEVALGPGEIAVGKTAVLVGTGSGPVRLTDVKPAGKRMMSAADWARGARPDAGERLA